MDLRRASTGAIPFAAAAATVTLAGPDSRKWARGGGGGRAAGGAGAADVARLRAAQALLRADAAAAAAAADAAEAEGRQLAALVAALAPHKRSFDLAPVPGAPRDATPSPYACPGAAACGGGCGIPPPAGPGADPVTVQAESVAAAALAVNGGRPVAALVDLLTLVVRRAGVADAPAAAAGVA